MTIKGDAVRNEDILSKVGVNSVEDKMQKNEVEIVVICDKERDGCPSGKA